MQLQLSCKLCRPYTSCIGSPAVGVWYLLLTGLPANDTHTSDNCNAPDPGALRCFRARLEALVPAAADRPLSQGPGHHLCRGQASNTFVCNVSAWPGFVTSKHTFYTMALHTFYMMPL